MNIELLVQEIEKDIISYRRHFHMYPELSKKEFKTQKKIMEILDNYDIRYTKAAKTGIVAVIGNSSLGKCIAIRADIDALPITEKNDVIYKSKIEGVMHACGHDAHTAMLLGAAIVLKKIESSLKGYIKLFFQPDEEVSAGAKRIVNEGHMDNPQVDYILGLHVMPYLETGYIEIKHGKLNASTGGVRLKIHGRASHAAYPHTGIDAIVVSADIISSLQSIISRNISPLNQVVLTFGTIKGGVKSNVISDFVELKGTLRTTDNEIRNYVKKRIIEVSTAIAASHNATVEIEFGEGYPALINDNFLTDKIIETATKVIGKDKIRYKEFPSMGGEDFGFYQEKAQGAFFHLGCGSEKLGKHASTHTDIFDINEKCLAIGVKLHVHNVLSLLNE
jgi:amidohydrolase